MKKLVLLSLMPISSVLANGECDSCPTECKPCCIPKPKKCIDCECYNPQVYDLQCDWGLFATADYLCWTARETNLEFANRATFISQPTLGTNVFTFNTGYTTKHYYVKSKWRSGFRVGLGMNFECDGWDLYLNWTNFGNHAKSRAKNSDFDSTFSNAGFNEVNAIFQPWANGDNTQLIGNPFVSGQPSISPTIGGKWSLRLNQIDLELGKKYWVSNCFAFRPYLGLRGAWTHTKFHVKSQFSSSNSLTFVNSATTPPTMTTQGPSTLIENNFFKNRVWGVGLLGGIQPEFVFGNWGECCGIFSLYGNLDGSLIWGKFTGRNHGLFVANFPETIKQGNNSTSLNINEFSTPVEKDNFTRMQWIVDLGIGLRWKENWCCDRFSTSIDLGWENHYWFDFGLYHRPGPVGFADLRVLQSQFQQPILAVPLTVDNFVTNLGFGGLVIRGRLDF